MENNVLSSKIANAGDFFFFLAVEFGTMLVFREMSYMTVLLRITFILLFGLFVT